MNSRISSVGRIVAIAAFLLLIGLGILAFVMTLNVREESMPPIPSTEWYMHDLKDLGGQVKDLVSDDEVEGASASTTTGQALGSDSAAGSVITGRVEAASGRPIRQFEVGVLSVSAAQANWLAFVDWTSFDNDDGIFSLAVAQIDGTVEVAARSRGYSTSIERITLDGSARDVVFELERGAEVLGRVLNSGRSPVEGASIYPTFDPNLSVPAAVTDSSGAFALTMPFTNREDDSVLALAVVHPDYVPATINVVGRPGSKERVEVVLTRGGTLTGIVARGGAPVADARITARIIEPAPGSPPPISRHAGEDFAAFREIYGGVSDANGVYTIRMVHPGELAVTIDGNDASCIEQMTQNAIVEDERTTKVDFLLAGSYGGMEVSVRVDDEAPSYAYVDVLVGDSEVELKQTASGRYRADCIPTGAATLVVSAPRSDNTMARIVRDLVITPNTVTSEAIELGFDGVFTGSCGPLDPERHTLVLALFGTLDTDSLDVYGPRELMLRAAAYVEPSPEGEFRLEHIERGDYTIVVASSDQDLLQGAVDGLITFRAVHATMDEDEPVNVTL